MTAYAFICENIDKTTRVYTRAPRGKKSLIGLPYPFTSPCIEGIFQEMYYWDTYFTCEGLYFIGRGEQAVNNVKNFIYLLENYGKIPNGNRMDYLSRSQPPFLGCMLETALERSNGKIALNEAFFALEKEYAFWQEKRSSANGLNVYGCDLPNEILAQKRHVTSYYKRTGIRIANTPENAKNVLCECESGWDFSPRFSSQCTQYNPVDLNCLLYKDEVLLATWAKRLGKVQKSNRYAACAQKRAQAIGKLMIEDGLYYDYNFVTGSRSAVFSCASLFPFFVGIDDDKQRFLKALARLEREYGLVACEYEESRFQWSLPNSWAPLNYVAFRAAERLGLHEDAKRIAQKYVLAVDGLFAKTGQLWEKYNAQDGGIDEQSEYGTPPMLGWSAGVYVACKAYLENI